jgi:hypothetical protein
MTKILNKNILIFIIAIIIGLTLIFYETISFNDEFLQLKNRKAVALVNDVVISEDQFLKYASNLGAGIQPEDDVEILELLLERMIEEELLVQRGIELDLHKKDIGVRKEMIKQVIDFIIQVEKNQISEEDLKDFYNKNIGKYTPIQKIQFQSIYINSLNQESVLLGTESDLKTLQPKLLKLYDELNTKDFLDIKYSYDENNFFEVPDKLINIKDCNLLFGKSICNQIASLNIDEVSQPIFFDNGYFIFKLVDQIKQEIDENYYNEIREKIIFDYNNGLDDEKLKNYLKYLKDNSEIIRYSF